MTLRHTDYIAPHLGSVTFSDNDYARILAEFPDITTPQFTTANPKYGVKHHIPTTGSPLHARARRLPPDKLQLQDGRNGHRVDYVDLAAAQKDDNEIHAYRTAISGLVLKDV
ncbi:hypothetical protein Pcinc_005109 [Petrolisthes cinctipes]|uniref:Uncharacterized protein n=1 Tax=Petrolisthes cinctipes TaxID=88211 RepID=A0AAE1GFQ2_PETCI|nr:hypothetical protein Pcinc_005109 [Petrolisthes cinctipes]